MSALLLLFFLQVIVSSSEIYKKPGRRKSLKRRWNKKLQGKRRKSYPFQWQTKKIEQDGDWFFFFNLNLIAFIPELHIQYHIYIVLYCIFIKDSTSINNVTSYKI